MNIKDLQKQNEKNNACKSTKAQRRAKLDKFKDKMHGMFGSPSISGFGKGQPLICDKCGNRVNKLTMRIIDEKLVGVCDKC